ncbi:MAG: helix-turn-helix transcriptional regulator, partial [Actinobacteria bacterium]|nr:helix-turn-helix transcriptional regulator [Actinomycetota bacterium]
MGRRPKYSSDQILDAAASLLAADGPTALSVARIAARLGAPSGSIYHRFGSRDVLVA